VNICHTAGCENRVNGTRGRAAYCPEHRGAQTLAEKLEALKGLAREADKLEAKARKLRQQADRAATAAGEKRDELKLKLGALSA